MLLPVAERRLGSAWTAVGLVVLHLLGVVASVGVVVAAGPGVGRWSDQLHRAVELGPRVGVVGAALLASAGLGPLQRRRLRLVVLAGLVMMALYSGFLGDVLRLAGGVIGLLLGMAVLGRGRGLQPGPSSRTEGRVLVVLLVAISAVEPLIAALVQARIGPLSALRSVFASPVPGLGDGAAGLRDALGWGWVCLGAGARVQLSGVGPGLMSVSPCRPCLSPRRGCGGGAGRCGSRRCC